MPCLLDLKLTEPQDLEVNYESVRLSSTHEATNDHMHTQGPRGGGGERERESYYNSNYAAAHHAPRRG